MSTKGWSTTTACTSSQKRRLSARHQSGGGRPRPSRRQGTVENRWALARRKGKPYALRYRQRRADGVYRWIEDRSEPFRDDGGKILQWYGVNLDIDDEVKAQEALRIADERLAKAARTVSLSELSISIAHDLTSPCGRCLECNRLQELAEGHAAKPRAGDTYR